MAANAPAAYAMYSDNVPLEEVLQSLRQAGFDTESICLLLSPTHPTARIMRKSSARPFEQEANVVAAGLISWLSEFGAAVIPTFGFFIRSQRFFHALVDRDSTWGCSHCGTLVSLGFSREDAERFEVHVREVGALLYVGCLEIAQARSALELLRATGAEEAGLVESEAAMYAAAH